MRILLGVALGAVGAVVTHHLTQSLELAVLFGCGLSLAVWFGLVDLGWDLLCSALAFLGGHS